MKSFFLFRTTGANEMNEGDWMQWVKKPKTKLDLQFIKCRSIYIKNVKQKTDLVGNILEREPIYCARATSFEFYESLKLSEFCRMWNFNF